MSQNVHSVEKHYPTYDYETKKPNQGVTVLTAQPSLNDLLKF